MKWVVAILVFLLVALQYELWAGQGGLADVWRLRQAVEAQKQENTTLQERNQALEAEVKDLKEGLGAIEERARNELGMIKDDETFFQIVDQ